MSNWTNLLVITFTYQPGCHWELGCQGLNGMGHIWFCTCDVEYSYQHTFPCHPIAGVYYWDQETWNFGWFPYEGQDWLHFAILQIWCIYTNYIIQRWICWWLPSMYWINDGLIGSNVSQLMFSIDFTVNFTCNWDQSFTSMDDCWPIIKCMLMGKWQRRDIVFVGICQ